MQSTFNSRLAWASVIASASLCLANPATSQPAAPPGMVWVEGREFMMGAIDGDTAARPDELPRHRVRVDGFWMDATEVTNAQFRAFVTATGYVTTAERKPDWEELKKQLPPGTPKPPDEVLVAGSLVFFPTREQDPHSLAWWQWVPGACWNHPNGPDDSIEGKDDCPVVQVSYDDAAAYAAWAKKQLPTEAQWECAARGKQDDQVFGWGNQATPDGTYQANYWQGRFPDLNTVKDRFAGVAPVKSFAPNSIGLFDMSGNVWEWTSDWYRADTYSLQAQSAERASNPTGPDSSLDPSEPTVPKKVVRGGSFLCHESYCFSFRTSARMKCSPDSAMVHTGFRCVQRP